MLCLVLGMQHMYIYMVHTGQGEKNISQCQRKGMDF